VLGVIVNGATLEPRLPRMPSSRRRCTISKKRLLIGPWRKCRPLKRSCADVGSVTPAVTAENRAFQEATAR